MLPPLENGAKVRTAKARRAAPEIQSLIRFGRIGPRKQTSQRPAIPQKGPDQDREGRGSHRKLGFGEAWAQGTSPGTPSQESVGENGVGPCEVARSCLWLRC